MFLRSLLAFCLSLNLCFASVFDSELFDEHELIESLNEGFYDYFYPLQSNTTVDYYEDGRCQVLKQEWKEVHSCISRSTEDGFLLEKVVFKSKYGGEFELSIKRKMKEGVELVSVKNFDLVNFVFPTVTSDTDHYEINISNFDLNIVFERIGSIKKVVMSTTSADFTVYSRFEFIEENFASDYRRSYSSFVKEAGMMDFPDLYATATFIEDSFYQVDYFSSNVSGELTPINFTNEANSFFTNSLEYIIQSFIKDLKTHHSWPTF